MSTDCPPICRESKRNSMSAKSCSQQLRLRVRLRRAHLAALDSELTQMMVEVLIHQYSPFHWSQRAEKEVRMLRAYPGPTRCKAVNRFTQPLPLQHEVPFVRSETQKLDKRKSLAVARTFSRIAGSGSMRAISIAPAIVEKIAKKARSLSAARRPGIKGSIRSL
jgi:hypothetical protein